MKRFLIILTFAFLCANNIKAEMFSVVCESGQTLNYDVTSYIDRVAVVYGGMNLIGDLVIPDSVTYNSVTYSVQKIMSEAFKDCTGLTSVTIGNLIWDIGGGAFENCSNLTSVTIGNSVMYINSRTFRGCSGLTGTLTIPNSVRTIYQEAFMDCTGITSIVFGNSLTNIGQRAFANCTGLTGSLAITCPAEIGISAFNNCSSLTSVIIGDSVTRIGTGAWQNCSELREVTIGNSVTSISNDVFAGCNNLHTINFNATNCPYINYDTYQHYESVFTNLPLTILNIGDNVTSIPAYAFCNCSNLSTVFIPNSVTSIGTNAFYFVRNIQYNGTATGSPWGALMVNGYIEDPFVYTDENKTNLVGCYPTVTEAVIPSSVTSIDDYAFAGCYGLAAVTIPSSVTNIGSYAFYGCQNLASVTIPNTVTSVGSHAFSGCSGLVEMTLPFVGGSASATEASESTLFGYIFGSTSYDGGTPIIQCYRPYYRQQYCIPRSLRSVTLTGSSLFYGAFYGCSMLTSVTIGNDYTSIGEHAFYDCTNLETVNFNATNCTVMGTSANPTFLNCSRFSNLSIGDNVINIPAYSFYKCRGLNSPQIPNSVLTIGDSAFYMVPNIVYSGSASGCPWGALSVNGYYEDGLFYTSMAKDTLVSALGTLVSVSIPNTVVSILPNAFNGCVALRYLTIGQSVRNIGNNAFTGCTSLDSITIGSSVKNIGAYAFSGCTGLSNVNVPDSVEIIGEYAFNACSSLTTLTIGKSVNRIRQYAFRNCQNLTAMNFNATSCSTMSRNTFTGCSSFSTLNIGKNVTRIPENAFYNCDKLAGDLIIPDSVTNIDDDCFYGCTRLTTVTIGKYATYIGSYAFNNCSGLTDIYIKVTTPPSMFSSYTFSNYSATLWVPCGYSETYASAAGWNSFSDIRESRTYLLNVESSNLQKGTVKITQHPNCDDGVAIISATPKGHFRFERWNDGNTDNPRTIVVESDTAFTATFAIAQYTITLVSIDETMGSVSENGTYDYGSEIQISATPAEHYHFVRWHDYITDNPRTITVTGNATYAAYFTIDQHAVTVTENNPAMGATWGSGNYDFGEEIDIAAYPRYGYTFLSWDDGNTDNPRAIIVTEDITYTANFGTLRTITVVSANETMGTVYGSGTYAEGTQVEISADAAEHYHFIQWNDENTDNPRTIVVYNDTTYIAEFAIDQHTVSVVSGDENHGTVSEGGSYNYGTEIQISANASEGYAFLSWNDGNTDNPRTIIVESDTTFTAIFATSRTVTIESSNSEMGYVIGSGEYAEGAVIEITAVPYEGYRFDHWVDVDNPSRDFNTDNPRTIVVLTDVTYVAVFTDVVGIENNDVPEISVSPNPASDILNITSTETISEIEIVNSFGQVVFRTEVNSDNTVCDVKGLASGVYVVRIQSKGAVVVQRRFVKE
jgi:hypothetical protein